MLCPKVRKEKDFKYDWSAMDQRSMITNLYSLVPEGSVGEVVLVDLICCGVYVNGSYNLGRYATLCKMDK